jgi:hypothetical protein
VGEGDPAPSAPSRSTIPERFINSGNLLSLKSEPEAGQIDRVVRQFRERIVRPIEIY